MTIYGDNYPNNFKNNNYGVKFMFKLVPDLSNNRVNNGERGFYQFINWKIPDNYCIYKIDVNTKSDWIIYYAPLKAAYPNNPAKDPFSGFINELNEMEISSYFYIKTTNGIKSSYVSDINPNYHHFCLTGMSNRGFQKASYAYYGGINNFGQLFSNKINEISYLKNNYIVEADIYTDGIRVREYYEPNYEGILTDIFVNSRTKKATLVFSYFILNAKYVE